jgi:GT2 family glycosyltransferase
VGCCVLCIRATFLDLGGYHEMYAPFFWEDVELGYRAWRRGLRVLHVPSASCRHEGSATLRETYEADERERFFFRNRVLFHLRNLQDPSRRLACLGALAALALFDDRVPRRRGLAEALERFSAAGASPHVGLSDSEILARVRGGAAPGAPSPPFHSGDRCGWR